MAEPSNSTGSASATRKSEHLKASDASSLPIVIHRLSAWRVRIAE